MEYHRILVAVDRSSQSEAVFRKALHLAKVEGARLKIFHCVGVSPLAFGSSGDLYGQGLGRAAKVQQELVQKEVNAVKTWLQEFVDRCEQEDIEAEFEYEIGEAGYWIREIALGWDADLVVLGRRGRSELAELFLGSVSNHVVHHLKCSVLIVQHPDD
ncbi:universal stress protein [Lyngbya sp. CCY1209]|uniref:universal stress protein n=1 Tax=Lyngbya sp. CCY1209 TaxID=2886103 RepID=UPI002D204C97|nr:universal stress protein [Lyngbya sp. CCY1209]MEB3884786.1 universal stress protein [Lyngbya sp. CCY1209]